MTLAPIGPVGVVARPNLWSFSTGDWHYLPDNPLRTLTQRSITLRVLPGTTSEASFTIDASLPEVGNINEEISDLWVAFNRQLIYRGRIGASSDTYDGNTHTVQFSAGDYRAILGRRFIGDSDTKAWTSTDQIQIAKSLIVATQAKTNGSLGIVYGTLPSSATQTISFDPGTATQEAIDKLSAGTTGANGFEWDLTPQVTSTNLTFNAWQVARGTDRGVVLTCPGGRVASLTRQVDPSTFANVIRATGGQDASNTDLPPQTVTASGLASDPAGRWEAQYADSDIKTTTMLTANAQRQLAASQLVTPSWTVTLEPDSWGGPNDIWLGDPITLQVKSGYRLNVVETLRVLEINIQLDDETDAATVALTLGAPPAHLKWNYRALDRRLRNLEKR